MKHGRRRRGRLSALLVVVVALSLGVAACGSGGSTSASTGPALGADFQPPASLVAEANKEGTVVMYSGGNQTQLQQVQTGFEKEFPSIKMEFSALGTGPEEQRITQEEKANQVQFDVGNLSGDEFLDQTSDYWAKLDPTEIPALKKLPVKYQRPNFAISAITIGSLIYNSDSVKPADLPKNPADLLNPKWKGKIAILPPGTGGTPDYTWYLWYLKYGGEAGFKDFLQKLWSQNPRVVNDGSTGVQDTAAGAVQISLINALAAYETVKETGAPIGVASFSPDAATFGSYEIPKAAPHPAAAKLLVDWLMSPKGLTIFNGNGARVDPYPYKGSTAAKTLPNVTLVTNENYPNFSKDLPTIERIWKEVTT